MRGALFVAAAATLWGVWPFWVRIGGAGGAATATIALGVCAAIGLPLAIASARGRARRPVRAWVWMGALGVCDAANVWCYFRALAEGAVAPAVISHYLAPVLVAIAAPWVLGEASSRRTPVALTLAVAGTLILVLLGRPPSGAPPEAVRHALLLGGASALFYAANVLISKKLGPEFSDAELLVYHAIVSAALLAAFVPLPAPGRVWLWPAVGGVASTLIAGLLYYAGLRRLPAERVGVLAYWEPVCAVIVGWIAFGESPGAAGVAGGALVAAAGVLVVTARP